MENTELFVGQELYFTWSMRNNENNDEIKKVIIKKIGRDYFYVEGDYPVKLKHKFNKETLCYRSDYSSSFNVQLYTSKQEILDKVEHSTLLGKLRTHFNYHRTSKDSLEQLRQVVEILKII